jgi:hypothetical protein
MIETSVHYCWASQLRLPEEEYKRAEILRLVKQLHQCCDRALSKATMQTDNVNSGSFPKPGPSLLDERESICPTQHLYALQRLPAITQSRVMMTAPLTYTLRTWLSFKVADLS